MSAEDVAAAGAIVSRLLREASHAGERDDWCLNDEARMALAWYGEGKALFDILRGSRGGENLRALGYDADIEIAAQLDSLDVVPRLNWDTQFITAYRDTLGGWAAQSRHPA